MKIQYRPAAIMDVQKASEYIAKDLKNPVAAARLREKILHSVSLLKENPFMGAPLAGKMDGIETELRYIVVNRQMVFYEPHEEVIEIIRILDGRTDYITQLF
jgi:plasmid stabilization system protein ParE